MKAGLEVPGIAVTVVEIRAATLCIGLMSLPRKALAAVAAAVSLFAVSGCGATAAPWSPTASEHSLVAAGSSMRSIGVGGRVRTYHLYRPASLRSPAPLVVMMHGGFGTGEQAERDYNWDAEADGGHFLVAYPDGEVRAWNAGSCCGEPQRTNLDDVGFITAMVSDIEQQIPIDPARVYATGMSNGAMMALRLGCQTDAFAAIAPVATSPSVLVVHPSVPAKSVKELVALAKAHPDVCRFDLAFMEAATGRPVQHLECLVRGGHACRFRLGPRGER